LSQSRTEDENRTQNACTLYSKREAFNLEHDPEKWNRFWDKVALRTEREIRCS